MSAHAKAFRFLTSSSRTTCVSGGSGYNGGSGGGTTSTTAITGSLESSGAVYYPEQPSFTSSTAPQYALTPIEDVRNADSSISTLKISKIGLTATAYDGDTMTYTTKLGTRTYEVVWVGTNPDACGDVQLSWDSHPLPALLPKTGVLIAG